MLDKKIHPPGNEPVLVYKKDVRDPLFVWNDRLEHIDNCIWQLKINQWVMKKGLGEALALSDIEVEDMSEKQRKNDGA